jgi:hypothetical protein
MVVNGGKGALPDIMVGHVDRLRGLVSVFRPFDSRPHAPTVKGGQTSGRVAMTTHAQTPPHTSNAGQFCRLVKRLERHTFQAAIERLKQHERHTFQAAIERLKHEHPLIDFDVDGAGTTVPSSVPVVPVPVLHWAEKNAKPPAFSGEGDRVEDAPVHCEMVRLSNVSAELKKAARDFFGGGALPFGSKIKLCLFHVWDRDLCRNPRDHHTMNDSLRMALPCRPGRPRLSAPTLPEQMASAVSFLRAKRPEQINTFYAACVKFADVRWEELPGDPEEISEIKAIFHRE